MFFPAYDPVFEEADAEGYRRDRALQVAAIVDYIDSDSLRNRERGTTEDYGYESLKDPYKPKNNYIDTVGELKLGARRRRSVLDAVRRRRSPCTAAARSTCRRCRTAS